MRVKILGSAAAECIPALFCECDTCTYAREHGGKDIRKRTAYLLDDDVLVDFGPDIFNQFLAYHIDERKINRLFFTHSHGDHLNTLDLVWRRKGYSLVTKTLQVYGDMEVLTRMFREWPSQESQPISLEQLHMEYHTLFAGDTVKESDLEVLALPADHSPREKPLNYVFTRNGKSLLIANDTGYFPKYSWELLAGKKLDAVIADCTGGISPVYGHNIHGHMGAFTDEAVRTRLIEMGCITEKTPFIINHFSHNAHSLHHEMVALMEPKGITVGYDGLELEL